MEVVSDNISKKQDNVLSPRQYKLVYIKIVIYSIIHIGGLYGAYLFFTKAKWQTCLFAYLIYVLTTMSVTAGVHRLWTHKAYKAKLPLQIILMFFYTMVFQDSVIIWVRDHRGHHKFSDTDADPHNSRRGLFFSHIGWQMVRKHPDVITKGQSIDLSDLWNDPLVRFQHRYYVPLALLIAILIPTYMPVLWGEKASVAFAVAVLFRIMFTLHITCLVNSAAHKWGDKPYDSNIPPGELSFISFLTVGEGFHNFHHTFPWDYRAAELGGYCFNWTRLFLDFMAKIGWAYDLKAATKEMIKSRVKRTGDRSHPVWGWGDKDMPLEDKQALLNYLSSS